MNFDEWLKTASDEDLKSIWSQFSYEGHIQTEKNKRAEAKAKDWLNANKGKCFCRHDTFQEKEYTCALFVGDEQHVLEMRTGEYPYIQWAKPIRIPQDFIESDLEKFREIASTVWKQIKLPVVISFNVEEFVETMKSEILNRLRDDLTPGGK